MNSQERPFLTIKEVSKFLGISVSTINRLIKRGEFPSKKQLSPRRFAFMRYEIEKWINDKSL
tara:strand:- start:1003 stop:1188 length:186 start_codon:yes stop_codon:yes gene_type:complete